MKFAVAGAGAIGSFVGALLWKSGVDVSLIARGDHMRAMRKHGLKLLSPLGECVARPVVMDDPSEGGPVDVVLLAMKAHSLTEMAPRLSPLIGDKTCLVTMQNGIPWWYFHRYGGPWDGMRLESVDPGGIITEHIDPHRVIGSVVHCSATVIRPGTVEHVEGTRISIGELDGRRSDRCVHIAGVFDRAGLRCPIRRDIRREIWVKLMGNVAFNPISAVTRATMSEIAHCPETRLLVRHVMAEVHAVAMAVGVEPGISVEERLAGAEKVGPHKTSMLQDVEAGRPLEIEAIVGPVVELGERLGISLPHTRTVYACAKLLDRAAGRQLKG